MADLIRRANRWQEETRRQAQIETRLNRLPRSQLTWTSLVEQNQHKNLRAQAVTDAKSLIQLSLTMHNCLHDFPIRCAQGHSRIDRIDPETGADHGSQENEPPVAPFELHLTPQGRTLGQIEGPRRSDIPQTAKRLAQLTCQLYDQAWQEN